VHGVTKILIYIPDLFGRRFNDQKGFSKKFSPRLLRPLFRSSPGTHSCPSVERGKRPFCGQVHNILRTELMALAREY